VFAQNQEAVTVRMLGRELYRRERLNLVIKSWHGVSFQVVGGPGAGCSRRRAVRSLTAPWPVKWAVVKPVGDGRSETALSALARARC